VAALASLLERQPLQRARFRRDVPACAKPPPHRTGRLSSEQPLRFLVFESAYYERTVLHGADEEKARARAQGRARIRRSLHALVRHGHAEQHSRILGVVPGLDRCPRERRQGHGGVGGLSFVDRGGACNRRSCSASATTLAVLYRNGVRARQVRHARYMRATPETAFGYNAGRGARVDASHGQPRS
jgi:hypothetical protein